MSLDTTPIPTEAILQPQPSLLHKIFIGKNSDKDGDSLRAGWSLLLFIAMLVAVIVATHFIVLKLHHPAANSAHTSEDSAKSTIINEGIIFVVVLLLTWIMSRIERRPNSIFGLGGTRKFAHFFAGLGWGVVCLSLLVLTLWKARLLVFDSRLLFGSDIFRWGAIWLLGFLLVGLVEEYLTRGYLQYTLTRGVTGLYGWALKTQPSRTDPSTAQPSKTHSNQAFGFWTSAFILSILFALGHGKNAGESPLGLLSVFLVAMVFCLSLWRTGSLWWAIGFHSSWDWAQSFLYGVADSGHIAQHRLLATHPVGSPILSGGATGPEGSIFILAIFCVVLLIIFLTLDSSPDHAYRAEP